MNTTKQKKVKTLQNKESASAEIDILIKNKIDFQLIISNYTQEIKCNIDYFNKQYIKQEQSKQVFSAYQKIKANLQGQEIPQIDKYSCEYYTINPTIKTPQHDVYNIDIKSAYATILYNYGYMSEDTYKYIQSLEKMDRLASVGMLAGRKTVFNYEKGVLKDYYEITKETESIFYFAVKQTFEIIKACQNEAGKDFLFSWVDGIYFKKAENIDKIVSILELNGLNFSIQKLNNFKIIKKTNFIFITFTDSKEKKKIFNIPLPDSQFKKHLLKKYNLI